MSFRLKTILGIALIESLVMLILIAVNQFNLGGSAGDQLFARAQSTAMLFATLAADAVISTDLATLDAMIENSLSNDELIYLRVRDVGGQILSEGGQVEVLAALFAEDASFDTALSDHRIDLTTPVRFLGQSFGHVELGLATTAVETQIASALRWNIFVAAVGMTMVAIFGYALGSVLTRQLHWLQEGANRVASGDLEHRIPILGRDELAETAVCFNQMATRLDNERAELQTQRDVLLDNKKRVSRIVACMREIARGNLSARVPETERRDEIGEMARATEVFDKAMSKVESNRLEQARLIRAFDQLDEHVAIFDASNRRIFANKAFESFNAQILDRLPREFTYGEFIDRCVEMGALPGALADPEGWRRQWDEDMRSQQAVELARAGDVTLLVRHTAVEGIGLVATAIDITELRASQARLVQASKLATLGEMSAGVAHELNQPLGVIRMASNNCVRALDRGKGTPDYLRGKLQRIEEQTERAAQIITHMRIFGRTADNRPTIFDAVEAVRNVRDLMVQQLALVNVKLTMDIPSEPLWTTGQQVLFEQVFMNLISNARDAIKSREDAEDRTGHVTVSATQSAGDQIKFFVRDDGPGVPEHILDRVFDPFFTTKEPGKGTGLGLSITYSTIRDMGGTVAVTNTLDGAMFEIAIPRCAAPQSDSGVSKQSVL